MKKLQDKQQILTPEGNIEDVNKREIKTKIYMVHQKCVNYVHGQRKKNLVIQIQKPK